MLLHEAPCSSELGVVTVIREHSTTRSDHDTINLQHPLHQPGRDTEPCGRLHKCIVSTNVLYTSTVACRHTYQPGIIELPVEDAHGMGRGALQASPQPNCCLIRDGLLHLSQVRPPLEDPACLASLHQTMSAHWWIDPVLFTAYA